MADNSPQGGADTIATDELVTLNGNASSGVKVQRVKPGFGLDGDFTDVSNTNPLPVVSNALTEAQLRNLAVDVNLLSTVAVQKTGVAVNSGSLGALNAVLALPVSSDSGCVIEITGTWSGTISFEAGAMSTRYSAINVVTPLNSVVSSTTGNGLFRVNAGGLFGLRVRMSAFTSGSAAIIIRAADGAGVGTLPLGAAPSAGSVPVTIATDVSAGTITTQNTVPAGVATAGSAVEIVLNGAASIAVQTVGVYTGALSLQATVDGNTWITIGGTPFLNVATGGYLSTITSALQGLMQADVGGFTRARISALSAVTGSVVVSVRTAAAPVMLALDQLPSGSNVIGSINAVTSVASVNSSTPSNSNTSAATFNSASTTNATLIKNSAASVFSITASNAGAAVAFLKVFNLTVSPTVGTSVPVLTIPIPAGVVININFGSQGIRFSAGLSFSVTNLMADADTTAVAAAQVKALFAYI
jgi:hypothetical protein